MSDGFSSLVSTVPKLTGTENYVAWRRAFNNLVLASDITGILSGRESEPFRKAPTFAIPRQFPIDEERQGLAYPGPEYSITGAELTPDQLKEWVVWHKKEEKARAAIMMTVCDPISLELESKWSAKDMWDELASQHTVATPERRARIQAQILSLKLPNGADSSGMLKHLEDFIKLVAEITAAGLPYSDELKSEIFLMSLPSDLESIHTQYHVLPVHSWPSLTRLYKSLADRKAIISPPVTELASLTFTGKGPSRRDPRKGKSVRDGRERPNSNINANRNSSNRDNRDVKRNVGKPIDKSTSNCNHCGIKGHWIEDCRSKKNGLPSKADQDEGQRLLKEKRDREGRGHYAQAAISMPQVFDSEQSFSASAAVEMNTSSPTSFLIDSGATQHIVRDASLLHNVQKLNQPIKFRLAESDVHMESKSMGCLTIKVDGSRTTIKDVFVIPTAHSNLLSWGRLTLAGWDVDMRSRIASKAGRQLPIIVRGVLPYLEFAPTNFLPSVSLAASVLPDTMSSPLAIEHKRLGHIGRDRLLELAKNSLLEYDYDTLKDDPFRLSACTACMRQKLTASPHDQHSPRGTSQGEVVHVDITGPLRPSADGNVYLVAMLADWSKIRQLIPVKRKDQSFAVLSDFVTKLDRRLSPTTVKVIRSDRGGEFDSTIARSYYQRTGIAHQMSPRYDHPINGIIERFIRTGKEMMASMGTASALWPAYWDFAARYAAVILDKTTKGKDDTAYAWTSWTSRDSSISSIREFGELCFVQVPREIRSKTNLDDRAIEARILGQDEATSGWIVRFEHNGEIQISRDIRSADGRSINEPLKIQISPSISQLSAAPTPPAPALRIENIIPTPNRTEPPPSSSTGEVLPAIPEPSTPIVNPPDIREQTPHREISPAVSAPNLRRSVRFANQSNMIQDQWHGQNARNSYLASEFVVSSVDSTEDEPRTIADALALPDGEKYKSAVIAELANLIGKGTFQEVTLPPGRKAIGCRWVFKRKRDADGHILKYKARLVAQGFSQQPGIDYEETYAPVSRITSLRILLAHAATLGLSLGQMDVEGAYLNGKLDVELYMKIPEGIEPSHSRYNALRVVKTLYGLKQSGRAWWIELGNALSELGYDRLEMEWGLYVKRENKTPVGFILAYVDDMVCAAQPNEIRRVVAKLGAKWKITDLGEVNLILGIKAQRDLAAKTVSLSQTAYIETLINRFPGHQAHYARSAPLPTSLNPEGGDDYAAQLSPYQQLVGCLLWISGCTRPDVAFTASYLSRFASNPLEHHWQLALRAVSYLVNTKDLKLVLGGRLKSLETYVDSDWGGDLTTRRSTTGYISYLHGSPIAWCSRRQATVAASTMEAEYVACAEATLDVIWLRGLLDALGIVQDDPTVIHIDNQAAIKLSDNPGNHARSKHIDIKHHLVRERITSGEIQLEYVNTEQQRADILTKSLPGPKHGSDLLKLRLLREGGVNRKNKSKGSGM